MRFFNLPKKLDSSGSFDFSLDDGVVEEDEDEGVETVVNVFGVGGAVGAKVCVVTFTVVGDGVEGRFDGEVEMPYTITASAFRRLTVVV